MPHVQSAIRDSNRKTKPSTIVGISQCRRCLVGNVKSIPRRNEYLMQMSATVPSGNTPPVKPWTDARPHSPFENGEFPRPTVGPAVFGRGNLTSPARSLPLLILIFELLMIPSSAEPDSPPMPRLVLPRSLGFFLLPPPPPSPSPMRSSREGSASYSDPPLEVRLMLPDMPRPPGNVPKLSTLGIGVSSLGILKPPR